MRFEYVKIRNGNRDNGVHRSVRLGHGRIARGRQRTCRSMDNDIARDVGQCQVGCGCAVSCIPSSELCRRGKVKLVSRNRDGIKWLRRLRVWWAVLSFPTCLKCIIRSTKPRCHRIVAMRAIVRPVRIHAHGGRYIWLQCGRGRVV